MDGQTTADAESFLDSLGAPSLKTFDAFPKTAATYRTRSTSGGLSTIALTLAVLVLVWMETKEYLYGEPKYSFAVDHGVGHSLQINVDVTVAMPCHFVTVDVRDAVGDRLHVSDEFSKDGTTFEIGQAHRLQNLKDTSAYSASRMVSDSRGKAAFGKTRHIVPDGPACRIYGAMLVKKVTGNLHVTTLGHGYMSYEHTDHNIMNLSHVIHEFSFGPFFPRISQPLDNTLEITQKPFYVFQYFISVVATTYVDRSRRHLETNQYSVTDMTRETEHGQGVPGIFLKYDIEPMALKVEERTMLLHDYLIRLAGIIGGLVICTSWAFRVSHGAARMIQEAVEGAKNPDGLLSPKNGHAPQISAMSPPLYSSPPSFDRQASYDRNRQSYVLG